MKMALEVELKREMTLFLPSHSGLRDKDTDLPHIHMQKEV